MANVKLRAFSLGASNMCFCGAGVIAVALVLVVAVAATRHGQGSLNADACRRGR